MPASPSSTAHSPAQRPARDRILDAFAELLGEQSERAATLDAVAARAGVSKGGLLYHFASKDALVDGLLERLRASVADDVERMRTAPDGPVDYFIRTSIATATPESQEFERSIVAVARLAQGADERARDALAAMQHDWLGVLEEAVGDPVVARTIMLLGDGIYYNTALLPSGSGVLSEPADLERLLELVHRLAARD
ncbi:TetR/AcrR family transcriptional regulator [Leifsonia sp. F6_8S_P_1B]|uniref:TetR/AcrR family transcriptional regulator n=1 Tax=Leifsonia williamsii TaxID=3035919 RepID=A0ABT8KBV4_9MICO|nr:TetR/AcrR family transcriptional regulator [Leifsonia williamsii]MDN4614921.1 TetR/AcrR family transcriptional regulator [Leifsonia williamsii]